jgi:methionyl-tRNA formyltransferase
MKQTFDIIFMGTPDFSVPSLKALHNSDHCISLVVTQPDRPKGRGRKVISPPVKQAAVNFGYDVIQPQSLKDLEFNEAVRKSDPDFFIVVAFGRILSKKTLQLPKIGTINLHASLLPKYRGGAPIQWSIIKGEKETGVTTMLMDEGMDTGDILLKAKEKISSDDTAATLHDRLAQKGADLLIETLKRFSNNDIHPVPQDHAQASYAPLLKKSDGHIDWQMSALDLAAFIRGMTPWPGAFAFYGNNRLKILSAKAIESEVTEAPGTVIKGFPDELRVATAKGLLLVLEIQGASGKRLMIKDFLRGYKLPVGTILK